MTVQYIPFYQPPASPFQFQAQFDGNPATVLVPNNLYARRYYVFVYNADGSLFLSIPRVESPDDYDFNLLEGYCATSTLVYRDSSNQFEVGP